MNKIFKRFLSALLVLSFIFGPIISVENVFADSLGYDGSIREVNVTPGEDASSEAIVSFSSREKSVQENSALSFYGENADDAKISEDVVRISDDFYNNNDSNNADTTIYHTIFNVNGLKENTRYSYKITSGEEIVSGSFKTAPSKDQKDSVIRFGYIGDPQVQTYDNGEATGALMNLASNISKAKPLNFFYIAGDHTNWNGVYGQWDDLFHNGGKFPNSTQKFLLNNYLVSTPGNHDDGGLDSIINNKSIGNGEFTSGTFARDFGLLKVIVLNNQSYNTDDLENNEDYQKMISFLKEEAKKAKENDQWVAVMFHKPLYTGASHVDDGDVMEYRKSLNKELADLDVDMVLAGHDHVFSRGFVNANGEKASVLKEVRKENILGNEVQNYIYNSSKNAPLHMVSEHGGSLKWYKAVDYTVKEGDPITPNYEFLDRNSALEDPSSSYKREQTYVEVEVSKNKAVFTTYKQKYDSASDEIITKPYVYDKFTIVKNEEEINQKDIEVRFDPNGGRLGSGLDFTTVITISKDAHPQVLPEDSFIEGITRAEKEVNGKDVKFLGWKIENSNTILTEEELKYYEFKEDTNFIAVWDEEASKYPPTSHEINKYVGEKVSENEVLDAVSVLGYPEGDKQPTKKLKYDASNLPDGSEETNFIAYVIVTYPDGSSAEARVMINILKKGEDPTPEDPTPEDPTPGEVPGTDPIPGEKPGTRPDPKPEVKPEPKPEKNIFEGIELERQAGDNRYKTAVEISKKNFESAETVILANGEKEADALAASVLAKEKNAPILLIKIDQVPDEVAKEIERLGAKNIILIGGLNSVTQKAVENLKLNITRIAGKDRFETAVEIAKAAGKTEKLILANGQSLVDALTASSLAQVEDRAVILVNKEEIPKVAKELVEKAKDILIVGGENSVKLGVKADRISGKDRFETAVKIAERAFKEPKQIALANSTAYADALVFGGVTGKVEAPILLTNKDKLPQVVKEYLERNQIEKIFVLGGENSVSENLFK